MTWMETTLGQSCEMYQPQTITTKDLIADGKYLVYGANGVIGRYDKYNHEEPQLLITCRGATCGTVNISSPNAWINGNAMVIKPKLKDISLKFLEYYFRGAVDLSKAITGAAQPQITRQSLNPIKFSYPSLAIQQKIVEKLDAIFTEIERATTAIEANIQNAEALFQSYLDKSFNFDLDGLKEYKLGEVCKFIGGSQPPKSNFEYTANDTNIRFIQIRDYKNDKNIVYIPKSLAKRFCDVDDVMIGRYGPPVFQILRGITGSYNVALMKAVPDERLLTKDFLFYFLSNPVIQNYIISLSNRAAGQSGLNKETIEPFPIRLPPIDRQNEIVSLVLQIKKHSDNVYDSCQLKLKELVNLKQSIIKQAFNGELVKE